MFNRPLGEGTWEEVAAAICGNLCLEGGMGGDLRRTRPASGSRVGSVGAPTVSGPILGAACSAESQT